jgi:tetratricopeptide (TPR) repeat protein
MPAQLGLFEDRTVRLQRARRLLLESLDLEGARDELAEHLRAGPDRDAEALVALVAELEEALECHQDELAALLQIELVVPDWLRAGWHRRLAMEAEQRDGAGCRIGDKTSGWHHLRAGDLREAARSLGATLARDPGDARSRAYLGDAYHRQGERVSARREYRRALVEGPRAVDWSAVAAPDVAALPAVAANGYEVPGAPETWAAAVGTVDGILDWPPPELALAVAAAGPEDEPGLRFYRLLCAERLARTLPERAPPRRAMKALCPALLEAYLAAWR